MLQCCTGRCLMFYMLKVMLLTGLQKVCGPFSLFTKIRCLCSSLIYFFPRLFLPSVKLFSCWLAFFHGLSLWYQVGGIGSWWWNRGRASNPSFAGGWCHQGFSWIACFGVYCHWHPTRSIIPYNSTDNSSCYWWHIYQFLHYAK